MPAVERYELVIRRRPLSRRLPRLAIGLVRSLGGEGRGPIWPITGVLVDRVDGRIVGELHNTDGHAHDVIGVARADLMRLDEAAFEEKWLPDLPVAP